MSDKLTLQQKLLKVQLELKAPKSNFNKFGGFKYRSLEDILEAVKPINDKYGLTLTLTDKPIQVGSRYYIEAIALITDNNQEFRVTAYAREPESKTKMDDAQVTGTSSSYARKYALNGLYLIDDTKDADTDEFQKQTEEKMITQKQVGELKLKAKQFATLRGQEEVAVYTALGFSDITKISEKTAKNAIKRLDGWIEKANEKNA